MIFCAIAKLDLEVIYLNLTHMYIHIFLIFYLDLYLYVAM